MSPPPPSPLTSTQGLGSFLASPASPPGFGFSQPVMDFAPCRASELLRNKWVQSHALSHRYWVVGAVPPTLPGSLGLGKSSLVGVPGFLFHL